MSTYFGDRKKPLERNNDDLYYALGHCLMEKKITDPAEVASAIKTASELFEYNHRHVAFLMYAGFASSRGYLFRKEREEIRRILDEMDALPDQEEMRAGIPRVPMPSDEIVVDLYVSKKRDTSPVDLGVPESHGEVLPDSAEEQAPPFR